MESDLENKRKHYVRSWWFLTLRFVLGFNRTHRLAHWWAFKYGRTFTAKFSDHEDLYYIDELCGFTGVWMAVKSHVDFPPPEHDPDRFVYGSWSQAVSFDGNKYWRGVLSFSIGKVRTRQNKYKILKRSDQLVQDYMYLEMERNGSR